MRSRLIIVVVVDVIVHWRSRCFNIGGALIIQLENVADVES